MKDLMAVFTICFLTLFISSCALAKVTDPKDPAFDITQFRFEDYKGLKKFRNAMQGLFPVGTSKNKIEEVLVGYGGGQINDTKMSTKGLVYYWKKEEPESIYPCTFIVKAKYRDEKLQEVIDVNYGCDGP